MKDSTLKNKIIEALEKGVSRSVIAKKTGIPRVTLYWKIKHDKDYQMAIRKYETFVMNLFEE